MFYGKPLNTERPKRNTAHIVCLAISWQWSKHTGAATCTHSLFLCTHERFARLHFTLGASNFTCVLQISMLRHCQEMVKQSIVITILITSLCSLIYKLQVIRHCQTCFARGFSCELLAWNINQIVMTLPIIKSLIKKWWVK